VRPSEVTGRARQYPHLRKEEPVSTYVEVGKKASKRATPGGGLGRKKGAYKSRERKEIHARTEKKAVILFENKGRTRMGKRNGRWHWGRGILRGGVKVTWPGN